jgi:predicted nucleic-acid-binding protein
MINNIEENSVDCLSSFDYNFSIKDRFINVNKNGTVISAIPGYRGTKNPTSCMLAAAKSAAMSTKWEVSPTDSEKQEGTITYIFKIQD